MDSVFQEIKRFLTSSSLPSYDAFFELLNEASECLDSERGDYRPLCSDGSTGSLIDFHKDYLPLIVIPDLHARPYFLLNILEYQIFDDMNVFEALEAGRVRLLSVGDILHTERHTRERWAAAAAEFDNEIFTGPALSAEMQEGLCLWAGLLKLKVAFPSYVHILKGNHENILNATGNGDFAFRKFADEGEMGMVFVQDFYGDDITKLLIKKQGFTGYELSEILYSKFCIEDERTNEKSTLLLTGLGTTKKKLNRLEKLKKI